MIPTEVMNDLIALNQCRAMGSRMQAILTALNWPKDAMQDTCEWLINNTQPDNVLSDKRIRWCDVLKDVFNDSP